MKEAAWSWQNPLSRDKSEPVHVKGTDVWCGDDVIRLLIVLRHDGTSTPIGKKTIRRPRTRRAVSTANCRPSQSGGWYNSSPVPDTTPPPCHVPLAHRP